MLSRGRQNMCVESLAYSKFFTKIFWRVESFSVVLRPGRKPHWVLYSFGSFRGNFFQGGSTRQEIILLLQLYFDIYCDKRWSKLNYFTRYYVHNSNLFSKPSLIHSITWWWWFDRCSKKVRSSEQLWSPPPLPAKLCRPCWWWRQGGGRNARYGDQL